MNITKTGIVTLGYKSNLLLWGGGVPKHRGFVFHPSEKSISLSIICRIVFNTSFILLEIKAEMSNLNNVDLFLIGVLYRVA